MAEGKVKQGGAIYKTDPVSLTGVQVKNSDSEGGSCYYSSWIGTEQYGVPAGAKLVGWAWNGAWIPNLRIILSVGNNFQLVANANITIGNSRSIVLFYSL